MSLIMLISLHCSNTFYWAYTLNYMIRANRFGDFFFNHVQHTDFKSYNTCISSWFSPTYGHDLSPLEEIAYNEKSSLLQ
jgi:hypothetical protein